MKVFNFTGHQCSFKNGKEFSNNVDPSSIRIRKTIKEIGEIEWIKVFDPKYYRKSIILPKQTDDKILIVSQLLCQSFPERADLYIPYGSKNGWSAYGIVQNPFYKSTFTDAPLEEYRTDFLDSYPIDDEQ